MYVSGLGARFARAQLICGLPSKSISLDVAASMPTTVLSRVLLPQPLSGQDKHTSPGLNSSETSVNTGLPLQPPAGRIF